LSDTGENILEFNTVTTNKRRNNEIQKAFLGLVSATYERSFQPNAVAMAVTNQTYDKHETT